MNKVMNLKTVKMSDLSFDPQLFRPMKSDELSMLTSPLKEV